MYIPVVSWPVYMECSDATRRKDVKKVKLSTSVVLKIEFCEFFQ